MEIKFIKRTEHKVNNTYEIESYNEIYEIGKYKLKKQIATLKGGLHYVNVDIEPINNKSGYDFYLPSIYVSNDHKKEPSITVQTSSYGSLDAEFLELYIEAYKHALEVVKAIETSDILK